MVKPTVGSDALPTWLLSRVFEALPVSVVVIRAEDLVMVTANASYLRDVDMSLAQIAGRPVFDVFPNSPLGGDHDQELDLRSFMRATVASGVRQDVSGFRYDIPAQDGFDVRFWDLSEVPILDADGRVAYLLHHCVDVTELRSARAAGRASQAHADATARRLAGLTEVAFALSHATTLEELEEIVVRRGTRALGAADGSLVTYSDDGGWRITLDPRLDDRARELYTQVPYDSPLPGCVAARTGRTILLPDQAAGLAFHPIMAEVYERRNRNAWALLPLRTREEKLGVLAVSWVEDHVVSDDELEVLQAFAAQCAESVQRLKAIDAERRTARRIADLAKSLQQAMLSDPPQAPGLDVQVRYRSAEDVAQVGGDWYDAFLRSDGGLLLVIGDIAGHDHMAAAVMGQVRVLMRSLAYTQDDAEQRGGYSPAAVLHRLEEVSEGLGLDRLATAVLARVTPPTGAPGESRRVTWSNAGNMPPAHVRADGSVTLLDVKPDLLLGVDAGAARQDHTVLLENGDSLLLFTDGLVERRGSGIDEGLTHLRDLLAGHPDLTLEELCDWLLAEMAPFAGEDDVALIAVRNVS